MTEETAEKFEQLNFLCEICTVREHKYKCPRCHIIFCSVDCYKSSVHQDCAEIFYKDCVVSELKHRQNNPSVSRQSIDIYHRLTPSLVDYFPDSDSDDDDDDGQGESSVPPLINRLQGLQLDNVNIWSMMTKAEQKQYINTIGSVQQRDADGWSPWWEWSTPQRNALRSNREIPPGNLAKKTYRKVEKSSEKKRNVERSETEPTEIVTITPTEPVSETVNVSNVSMNESVVSHSTIASPSTASTSTAVSVEEFSIPDLPPTRRKRANAFSSPTRVNPTEPRCPCAICTSPLKETNSSRLTVECKKVPVPNTYVTPCALSPKRVRKVDDSTSHSPGSPNVETKIDPEVKSDLLSVEIIGTLDSKCGCSGGSTSPTSPSKGRKRDRESQEAESPEENVESNLSVSFVTLTDTCDCSSSSLSPKKPRTKSVPISSSNDPKKEEIQSLKISGDCDVSSSLNPTSNPPVTDDISIPEVLTSPSEIQAKQSYISPSEPGTSKNSAENETTETVPFLLQTPSKNVDENISDISKCGDALQLSDDCDVDSNPTVSDDISDVSKISSPTLPENQLQQPETSPSTSETEFGETVKLPDVSSTSLPESSITSKNVTNTVSDISKCGDASESKVNDDDVFKKPQLPVKKTKKKKSSRQHINQPTHDFSKPSTSRKLNAPQKIAHKSKTRKPSELGNFFTPIPGTYPPKFEVNSENIFKAIDSLPRIAVSKLTDCIIDTLLPVQIGSKHELVSRTVYTEGDDGAMIPHVKYIVRNCGEKFCKERSCPSYTYQEFCPQLMNSEKTLNDMTSKPLNKAVNYNAINVLAAYIYTVRYFMEAHWDYVHEAASLVVSLSENLSANKNFSSVEEVRLSIRERAIGHDSILAEPISFILLDSDLYNLRRGPEDSNPHHYVLAAFSDLFRLLNAVKSKKRPREVYMEEFPIPIVSMAKIRSAIRKCVFYFQFVKEQGLIWH